MSRTPHGSTLSRRALSGMVWSYGTFIAARSLTLVATALLARILSPGEFGQVALALVLVSLLETLAHLGLAQALVLQTPADGRDDAADTAFWSTTALGVVVALAIAACGGAAAAFFDQPVLRLMLPVLSCSLVLRALGYTHYALAQRSLAFRQRSVAEIGEVLVRGVAGIALALAGFGAWSLIVAHVLGALTFTVALWTVVRWRPRLQLRRTHLRRLAAFGSAVTGVDLLSAVISNVDYVVIGRVLGPVALGLYTFGFKVPELLIFSFALVADRVLFPYYAAVPRAGLADAVVQALRGVLLVTLACAVAVVLLAEPIVQVLFGDQWVAAVPAARVLAWYAFVTALTIPVGSALKAVGRADLVLKVALPWAGLAIVFVVLSAPHGIVAVAGAQAAAAAAACAASFLVSRRTVGLSLRRVVRVSRPALLAAAAMAVTITVVSRVLPTGLGLLLLGGVSGAVAYVGVVALLDREVVRWLVAQVRPPRAGVVPLPDTGPPRPVL